MQTLSWIIVCSSLVALGAAASLQAISFQMPCPIFDCIYLACPSLQYIQNYAMIGGHKCPTCRTCVNTTSVADQEFLLAERQCPMFKCAVPQCPNGHYVQTYINIAGHNCSHCPVCIPDGQFVLRDVRQELEMPILDWFEDSGSHGCPSVICMATDRCDVDERLYSFYHYHGQKCEACPYCPKDDELLLLVDFEKST